MTWLAIKLFMGGMLKRLTAALGAVLRWAGRNPWQAAVLLLCGLCVGGYWHYSGKVEKLTATVAIRDKTISDMKAASKQAAKDQAAVNHQPAETSKQIAEKSNEQAPAYYADARRAADAHRVRNGASVSLPNNPDLPGADSPAKVDDGPAAIADVVSRPRADDDLLVAAAARAAKMHADAEALISAGIAVESE